MMNCLEELKDWLSGCKKDWHDIKFAGIIYRASGMYYDTTEKAKLPPNWNDEQLAEFIEVCKRISYCDGYGAQTLFGCVVFNDGSWLERHEYDGAEWWEYKRTPRWNKEDLKRFFK